MGQALWRLPPRQQQQLQEELADRLADRRQDQGTRVHSPKHFWDLEIMETLFLIQKLGFGNYGNSVFNPKTDKAYGDTRKSYTGAT